MTNKRYSTALAREIPREESNWHQINPQTIVNLANDARELVDTFVSYIGQNPPTEKLTAARQILKYMKVQLERMTSWAEGPADLNALIQRNLIELGGWTDFIAESNENAGRFCTEFIFELFEFGQSWMRNADGPPGGILGELCKSVCVVRTARSGQAGRSKFLDDTNYQSCSRLIQPGSLIINNLEFLDNDAIRRNCQVNALRLAEYIFDVIFSILKLGHEDSPAEFSLYAGNPVISFGT